MDADEELFFSQFAPICVHLRATPDPVPACRVGMLAHFCGKSTQMPSHEQFTRQNEFS